MDDAWLLIRTAWGGSSEARSSCLRYSLFLAAAGVGLVLSLAYKDLRFGSWFEDGKIRAITAQGYPLFVAGFLTLLISAGKSVFLYSPPLVLCLMGMRSFRQRYPETAELGSYRQICKPCNKWRIA